LTERSSQATLDGDQIISDRIGARSVVLIGMMGAGKTTVGRRLAARLGWSFIDADHEIEVAANLTIPEIFDRHGEAHFRDGEKRVIARLLEQNRQILATGGGAFMDDQTRSVIEDNGISVWLKADADLLMSRVKRKANRPLLQKPNPEKILAELIDERYPVYAKANLTVDSRDVPHEVIVDDIIEALANYLDPDRDVGGQRGEVHDQQAQEIQE